MRFTVYELEGWPIKQGVDRRASTHPKPGLTVWVADEAFNGKEVRVWESEDPKMQKGVHWTRFDRMRAEAHALADELNEEEATRVVACGR